MNRIPLATVAAAGLIAAAAALGTSAFGHPGVASAQPNNGGSGGEWDIEAYDNCLQNARAGYGLDDLTQQYLEDSDHYCCNHSGGVWNTAQAKCEAPAADTAGAQPTRQFPGRIPTTVLLPSPSTPEAPPPGSVK